MSEEGLEHAAPLPAPEWARLRRLRLILMAVVLTLTAGWVLDATGLLSWGPFQGNTAFLQAAFCGAFVHHAFSRQPRRELLATGLAGALIGLARFPLPHGDSMMQGLTFGAGLGLASVGALAVRLLRTPPAGRAGVELVLLPGVLVPAAVLASALFLELTAVLHPRTWDHALHALDLTLGASPAFVLGQLLEANPAAMTAVAFAYVGLPLFVLALVGIESRQRQRTPDTLLTVLVAGALGFLLYHLLPAAGPSYAFGDAFPWRPPPAGSLEPARAVDGFRNCIPSLHLAWALLVLWNTRVQAMKVRAFALALVMLTLIGTLGLGEHYVIDLVIAFPFAVAVEALTASTLGMAAGPALPFGAAATLSWIAALRWAMPQLVWAPRVTWTLAGLTVVLSLWIRRKAGVTPGFAGATVSGPPPPPRG